MTRLVLKFLLGGAFILLMGLGVAGAVEPDERLDDPALEERARDISQHLRCVVCQNQSIDESDAPLARDLRLLIRERLVAGDSNDDAIAFVVARYGDYVLLRPPFQPNTYVLWFGPFIIFLFGSLLMFRYFRTVIKPTPANKNKGDTDDQEMGS